MELTLRYTTPDIHCRHRRHECDDGIINVITIKEENRVGLVGEIVIAAFNGLIYYPDNNLAHSG